jgi:hypothetical protein
MFAVRAGGFVHMFMPSRDARWHLYEPEELMQSIIGYQHGTQTLDENYEEDKGKGDSYA